MRLPRFFVILGCLIILQSDDSTGLSPFDQWVFGRPLGSGALGDVFELIVRDERYAVKRYDRKMLTDKPVDAASDDRVLKEISLQQVLHHENIVQAVASYSDENYRYLVMEFCPNGDVSNLIARKGGRLQEPLAKRILYQVAKGLKYLHSERILHGDIKPGNILLDENMVAKITDFGFSTLLSENESITDRVGTELYLAPEIYLNEPHGLPADIWALGVTAFNMLDGRDAFIISSKSGIGKMLRGELPRSIRLRGAESLIRGMLNPDQTLRFTIDQVLADSWFDDLRTEEADGGLKVIQEHKGIVGYPSNPSTIETDITPEVSVTS